MFKIKLISWTIFLLVAGLLGEVLRTSDTRGARGTLSAVIMILFFVQLDMLGRYGKKQKPTTPESTGQLDKH